MAKKKSKPQRTKFNPINYLKTGNARKLPIHQCLLPTNWEEVKKFPAIVARKHVNNHVTFASVLVDLLCTGAKDVLFFVNEPESLYQEILENYEDGISIQFEPVSYELIHNVIFESVAFAEEFGIAPHEDFKFAELILEEDSDDFPRLEVPLGEEGKAYLYLTEGDDRAPYFERQILKYGKPGTFQIIRNEFASLFDEDDLDEDEDSDKYLVSCYGWDELDWEEFYDEMNLDELPNEILLYTISRLPEYEYDEMVDEPIFAPFLDIQHTEEDIEEFRYSKEELGFMKSVYENLQLMNSKDKAGHLDLLKQIEIGINNYPTNRVLHHYHWEYFQRMEDLPKALEIAKEMKEKFPDYLYSLSSHAQTLIEMGEVNSIPEAMNHHVTIQDFISEREIFHINELQVFYSPWIYYFSKTGQLRIALFLYNFLQDYFVLFSNDLHPLVENALVDATRKVVEPYYEKVQSRKVSKVEFVDLMMGEY